MLAQSRTYSGSSSASSSRMLGRLWAKRKACVQSQLIATPHRVYWYRSTHGSLGSGAGGGECRRMRAECSSSSCLTASAAAFLANSSAARAASTRSSCSLRGWGQRSVDRQAEGPLTLRLPIAYYSHFLYFILLRIFLWNPASTIFPL